MIHSMTGFARASRQTAAGMLEIELKSVNHRFFEWQCRMPEELRPLEAQLREAAAASINRGKVECRINLNAAKEAGSQAIDEQALAALAGLEAAVRQRLGDARPVTVAEALAWPGVLQRAEMSAEALAEAALAAFTECEREFRAARGREGAKLADLIRSRLAEIARLVGEAKPVVPAAVEAYRTKLAERVAEFAKDMTNERLQQEVVLFAGRIDVAEELDRLTAHVAEVGRILDKGGVAGKRLDFLMQELNREANTLGSKSVSTGLTNISVELKVLIEQMREQVQNIE